MLLCAKDVKNVLVRLAQQKSLDSRQERWSQQESERSRAFFIGNGKELESCIREEDYDREKFSMDKSDT